MRNRFLLAFIFACIATLPAVAQTRATTEDGRAVILRSDGTWSLVPRPAPESATVPRFQKSSSATQKIDAPHGSFSVFIDPLRWKKIKGENNKITLESASGKGYGLIIADALSIPKSSLKQMALHNAQALDPTARIVAEEKRVVNNREVLCLQMEAAYMSIPFTYYGYYYGGTSGNIQLVAFTERSQFPGMRSEFDNLLNGLVIADEAVPDTSATQTVSLNDGAFQVAYDTRKWKAPEKLAGTKMRLTNLKGNGWLLLIPESISFPLDSFPDIALTNAKEQDPNAKVIFREKRRVHGQDVWCLKISATVSSLPFIYYGYYYSGTAGSMQVVGYTTTGTFDEVEPDFAEILDTLQINSNTTASPAGQK